MEKKWECPCWKAKTYLNTIIPNIDTEKFSYLVQCGRCKKWHGRKQEDYSIPEGIQITKIVKLKLKFFITK